jgi:phage gpG-like protein
MLLNVTLTGDRELMAKLDRMPLAVHQSLKLKITMLTLKLEKHVKTNKLNGQVLNRISGRLARSIASKVVDTPEAIVGSVFSSGDVKYAAIHEFGGQTAPHLIVPKKAQMLAFMGKSGNQVFARQVNHPGSKMPERSFLRSALNDMSGEIQRGMKQAVIQGAQGAIKK